MLVIFKLAKQALVCNFTGLKLFFQRVGYHIFCFYLFSSY